MKPFLSLIVIQLFAAVALAQQPIHIEDPNFNVDRKILRFPTNASKLQCAYTVSLNEYSDQSSKVKVTYLVSIDEAGKTTKFITQNGRLCFTYFAENDVCIIVSAIEYSLLNDDSPQVSGRYFLAPINIAFNKSDYFIGRTQYLWPQTPSND